MAQDMGLGQEALISQAVFTLARLNGYVVPGKVSPGEAPAAAAAIPAERPVPAKPAAKAARGKAAPPPEPEPEPEPAPEESYEDDANPFDENDAAPQDDYPEDEPPPEDDYPEDEPEPEPPPKAGKAATLTMLVAGHDPIRMAGDVLTIGRGKTCDFVIDSNRVSREHSRITREGADFVMEDLNSSNGTFFGPNKEKITRRKIKDGDEFTLGTEKIKFKIGR